MTEKTGQKFLPITAFGELPGFQYGKQRFVFLNLGLDVEMDGVTYHLTSEFSKNHEMGEVIDTIELERSQRLSA